MKHKSTYFTVWSIGSINTISVLELQFSVTILFLTLFLCSALFLAASLSTTEVRLFFAGISLVLGDLPSSSDINPASFSKSENKHKHVFQSKVLFQKSSYRDWESSSPCLCCPQVWRSPPSHPPLSPSWGWPHRPPPWSCTHGWPPRTFPDKTIACGPPG